MGAFPLKRARLLRYFVLTRPSRSTSSDTIALSLEGCTVYTLGNINTKGRFPCSSFKAASTEAKTKLSIWLALSWHRFRNWLTVPNERGQSGSWLTSAKVSAECRFTMCHLSCFLLPLPPSFPSQLCLYRVNSGHFGKHWSLNLKNEQV